MRDLTAKELGTKLRAFRLLQGWSLDELSQRTEIKRSILAVYERGARFPGGQRILRIQRALGLDAEDLLPEDGRE